MPASRGATPSAPARRSPVQSEERGLLGALGSALAGIVDGTPNQAQSLVFFAGFMLSSLIWCFCCAALVDWLRRNTSLFWHRVSYAGCGVLLLGLAGLALRGL